MTRAMLGAAVLAALLAQAAAAPATAAEDDSWKIGRVYSRLVCTECHKAVAGRIISPNERTKAEWKAYFEADRHDSSGRSKNSVKYYASREYRLSVKDTNKAAAKFLDKSDDAMMQHVTAFFQYGAKDSDTPATCQ